MASFIYVLLKIWWWGGRDRNCRGHPHW